MDLVQKDFFAKLSYSDFFFLQGLNSSGMICLLILLYLEKVLLLIMSNFH